MRAFFTILFIIFSIKTISYGMYEIKTNKNKSGGISVIILALIGMIFPITVVWL